MSTDRDSVRVINTAREIATKAHRGQRDKIGEPYIRHPEAVAAMVQLLPTFQAAEPDTRTDVVAAAWLHDVIEDTTVTRDEIDELFGHEIAKAVVAITRRPYDAGDHYYERVAGDPIALRS